MVLYHAYHAGQLNLVLIHRLTKNKNLQASLLVGNRTLMGDVFHHLEKLIEAQIFNQILYCVEDYGCTKDYDYNSENVGECESLILEHFENIFQSNNVNVEDYEAIYSTVDMLHSFGIYLSLKNVHYFFIEPVQNMFQKLQNRVDVLPDKMKIYALTMTKHGASNGISDNITQIYFEESNIDTLSKKYIRFDFFQSVLLLDENSKNFIRTFFEAPILPYSEASHNLISTCSQWSIRELPNVKVVASLTYQLLADYLLDTSLPLIIKPHPLSRITKSDCEKHFPNAIVIEAKFPFNFLPLVKNIEKIESILSISSSTVFSVALNNNESICTGLSIWQSYILLHKTFFATEIMTQFCPNFDFFYYGIDIEYLVTQTKKRIQKNIIELNVAKLDDLTFAIIDNINWNKGNYHDVLLNSMKYCKDTVLVFLNSLEDYCFCAKSHLEYLDDIIPITIKKRQIKSDILCTLTPETIYIFTKNPETRRKIMNFSSSKELKYTGIEIYVEPTTEEQVGQQIAELRQKLLFQEIVELKQQVSLLPKELPYSPIEELQDLKEQIQRIPLQFPPPIEIKEENPVVVELLNQIVLSQNEKKKDLLLLHECNNSTQETLGNLVIQLEEVSLRMTLLQESQVQTQELESFVLVSKQSLYARLIQKIDQKYPKGSKKREFWKKFVEKFL